jgi:diguanylate cyclase (GGDEF)-like protein
MLTAQARFRRRSLAWIGWVLPALGLLVIVFMWAYVLHSLEAERGRVVADSYAKARSLNRAFEGYTERALTHVDQVSAFVAYNVEQRGRDVDLPGLLSQGLARQPGLLALYLTDARGEVIASTGEGVGASLAGREDFQLHAEGREPGLHIGKPQGGGTGSPWTIQLSRRLQTRQGDFAGIVVVSADPSYFTRFYDEQQHGRLGLITFLGLDRTVRARRSGDRLWYGDAAGSSTLLAALQQSPEGTYSGASRLAGVPRLLAYKRLADRPFVVVTGLAVSEVMAGHEARRRAELGTLAAVTCVLLLAFGGLSVLVQWLRRSERKRHIADRRLREVTDNLPALVAYIDTAQCFQFCNATFQSWLHLDPAAQVGRPMAEVLGPAMYEARRAAVERALAGERVEFDVETPVNGEMRCLHNVYIPDPARDGSIRGLYALSSDVSAQKAVERQLAALARVDALTGLPNRHALNERLHEALARAERSGDLLALMFLDVDRFKDINDRFGHGTGDRVLKEFGDRLRGSVRATDTVARLAGDEFVIVLEGLGTDVEPTAVAQKIVAQMNRPFEVDGQVLLVTTSIGVAFHRHGNLDPAALLARADVALYAAKTAGRNTFQLSLL